jgi:uncharacterized membrane protein
MAMFRAPSVANVYSNLGFVVAIVASLTYSMTPRAKFLETLIFSIFLSCLGCGYATFGLWASLLARRHTQSATDPDPYNAAAAGVSAVFLFVNVYLSNAFRAVCSLITKLIIAISKDDDADY